MVSEIKSGKIYVKEVFKQWYRIPEYQRPYVWKEEEVLELLEDITSSARNNKDNEYFLGSMVYQINKKKEFGVEYEENDLLDGQQRLTTLLLMMAVIRDLEKDKDLSRWETCRDSIYQRKNINDNVPERLRIVYDIREEVKEFIDKVVKEEGGTLNQRLLYSYINSKDISIKNMSNAILTINKYFEKNSIDAFFRYLRNKVLMIYVASENLEDAFRMFTILNDRGVKLRNSDILKANNLREVPDDKKKKEYAMLWEEIENDFGEDFDEFLSHIRTILAKDKALKSLLYEFDEKIYKPQSDGKIILTRGVATFEYVKKYHNHYNSIFGERNQLHKNNYEFENLISIMKSTIASKIWIPVVLAYYDKFGENELLKFIKKLDNKFSYDWINQETPTKRIENMNAIITKIEEVNNSEELFKSDKFYISINTLVNYISEPIYQKPYCKYLLCKLEYIDGTKESKLNIPNEISVEHILPQNPKENSIWMKEFSKEEMDIWTNKLGNLVLLGRRKNTSLGRLDYKEKKEKYFLENIQTFPRMIKILQKETWNINDLTKNQEETLKKIKDHYSS